MERFAAKEREMKFKQMFRSFLCNVMGWHSPGRTVTTFGIIQESKCKYCGKRIMQDSQGNWFSF